jgi:Abortive infection C-terminus
MAVPPPLIIELEQLQNNLIAHATGGGADGLEYVKLRAKLLREPVVKDLLPDFVHKYRDLGQFWGWIKYHLGTYRERRDLIWQAFRPTFEAVEKGLTGPVHAVASETLAKLDAQHVADTWHKVMTRIGDDPEGAITAARTLVESVCKLILDHLSISYDNDGDLGKLFKTTARSLKLAVDQHDEQVFKQILTGMGSVVSGFASLRNSLGDAHGKGKKPVRPAPRHAQLVVNIAGTMATFLVDTFEATHGEALRGDLLPPPNADS